jgi:hypothetical protein
MGMRELLNVKERKEGMGRNHDGIYIFIYLFKLQMGFSTRWQ